VSPLKITAHLYNGFVSRFPWSPSIDGILAWVERRAALGEEAFTAQQQDMSAQTPNENLPLEKIHDGELWWYACSNPIYETPFVSQRFVHKRFNMPEAEVFTDIGKIETTKGPMKNYRILYEMRVTDHIDWHVMGDADAIRDLLRSVSAIGGKLGAGYGRVKSWTVTDDGDEHLALFHRPLPVDYARRVGASGPVMRWGIRPPARIPANQAECVMPCAAS